MVKKQSVVVVFTMVFAALSTTVPAQDAKSVSVSDAKTILAAVAKAMGSENLKTIQYSGSGSSASVGQNKNPSADWPLVPVKSYVRELDLGMPASHLKLVRVQDGSERTQDQTILPNAAWDTQCDIWLFPFAFLKGAIANNATVESKTVMGEHYTVATFTLQNKYKVSGYIDDKNMIHHVETRVDNPVLGDTLVEATYDDYRDVGGVKFPMAIINKQVGHNTLILIVSDVKPNASVNIQPSQAR